jgi:uncharacterized protein (DUF3084 family)
MGEIVAGAGFGRDRLYVEWRLTYDPGVWQLQSQAEAEAEAEAEAGTEAGTPGLLQVRGWGVCN